jgi:hypothetical protein
VCLAFYYFILIFLLDKTMLGGRPVGTDNWADPWMFSAREENGLENPIFPESGRRLPSFFYVLSELLFAITMSQLLISIILNW